MESMNLERTAFQITLNGGNAKAFAHDALEAAKKGDYKSAESLLADAENEFHEGHEVHSETMRLDDKEDRIIPTMLLVHAKDHLMAARTEIALIRELIQLHKKIG